MNNKPELKVRKKAVASAARDVKVDNLSLGRIAAWPKAQGGED
jgi:hypothetical protein